MEVFIAEFFHFVAVILAATVLCATMAFFYVSGYRCQETYQYVYATSALLIAGAMLGCLVVRVIPELSRLTTLFEAGGLFLLFVAVFINPEISCVAEPKKNRVCPTLKAHKKRYVSLFLFLCAAFFAAVILVSLRSENDPTVAYQVIATVFALFVNITMLAHFVRDKHHGTCFKRSTWLLTGYGFLLLHEAVLILHFFPPTTSPLIERLNAPFGFTTYAMSLTALIAFLFLGRWSMEVPKATLEPRSVVDRFLERGRYAFSMDSLTTEELEDLGVADIPAYYLYRSDGTPAALLYGPRTPEALQAWITDALR